MRNILMSSALGLGAVLASGAAAIAADDGFFNVSYNDIGFSLTQIGGYGELVIEPQGHKGMGYGSCTVNYTRDEAGKILEMTPVLQQSSATCPESLAFELRPGEAGRHQLSFSAGGPLAGQSFELFPVLLPMSEALRITAPKGFDILGLTVGQTRAEIETLLADKGYSRLEANEESASYQGGFTKGRSLWGKGATPDNPDTPADQISVSYTAVIEGEASVEKAEYVARFWRMAAEDNLSLANLRKSLDDKHGKTTSGFESRFYDRSGALQPESFQPVCDSTVHLQQVNTTYSFRGNGGELILHPACGTEVKILTSEDYDAKGRAAWMEIGLLKGDIAYESFWSTWSRREAKDLQARYELQANMTGAAPEL